MKAIVTVKLPRNPKHNPHDKQTGWCPISEKVHGKPKERICTDVTGSHHSYIETGLNRTEIEQKAREKFKHITRIECFDEEGPES